jgi:MHS family proline/betaine transporter-like MFS transporter
MSRETSRGSLRPIVLAGAVGNVVEWYDFALYGYFAPLIGALFFPATDPIARLLAAFGVFAVGYLMRPVGSVLFGYVGDRLGRRRMLVMSVLLMAIPSALVGLLPTYRDVGLLAPVLLIALRMFQGLSAGGEYTGSAIFLIEHAAPGRRALTGSAILVGGGAGFLAAAGLGTALTGALSHAALEAWGWRVPFLLGLVSAAIALYLRMRAEETPLFAALARQGDLAANPLADMLGPQRRAALLTVGLATFQAVGFYLPWVFLPNWMQGVREVPAVVALTLTTINMAWTIAVLPVAGALCDALGRRAMLIGASTATVLLALPAFLLMTGAPPRALWPYAVGQGLLMLLSTVYNASLLTTLVELFPTRSRATAMSVSYSLAAGVFGGTTPLVCTWLVRETHAPAAPAIYLMLAALLALVLVARGVAETSRRPLG